MSGRYLVLGLSSLFMLFIFAFSQSVLVGYMPQWASVIPPVIAIGLALLVRKVLISLFIGIISGCFLYSATTSNGLLSLFLNGATNTSILFLNTINNYWNIQIIIFLVSILVSITIMLVSGGLKGILAWLEPYAKTGRSAQLVAYIMGLLIFIDDYANTVLVGSSMRPIADKYKVSREKLAFIVDSTSAPVSGIAFISTWIGYEVGQIGSVSKALGISQDGYSIFFDIVTFRFYCLLMLVFVLINILSKKEFGPMAKAEILAKKTNNTNSINQFDDDYKIEGKVNAFSALLPLLTLFVYFIIGLWFDGGGNKLFMEDAINLIRISSWREVVSNSENNMTLLMQAGILCFLLSSLCAFFIANLPLKTYCHALCKGFKTALVPILILILAWTLKATCDLLDTSVFMVNLISASLPSVLFPVVVFILSAVTAIATGTSWGTMAILIPIVMPIGLAFDNNLYGLITMLSIAAVLDGSIFGDHCSPISDTTIMSSIATSCNHMQHVITQFPYALFVCVQAILIGYLPAAFGISSWLCLIVGTLVTIICFMLLRSNNTYNVSDTSE